MRDGPNHALSARSGHRLWIMQRSVRRDESEDGPGEELLGRGAVALWKSGERSYLSFSTRLADGYVAARSGSSLLRIAICSSHARQRRHVGKDLARSNCASELLPGRQR